MTRALVVLTSRAAREKVAAHLDETHSKKCAHCGGRFYRDKRCTWAHWHRAKMCSRECTGLARSARASADRPPLRERFNSKVKVSKSGCWQWQGARDSDGYGVLSYAGKMLRAPKVALALDGRSVPKGMYACHTCDNPWCVRPDHLYVGTPKQNSADAKRRGRLNPGRKAKLAPHQVRLIRAAKGSHRQIALQYNVSRPTVSLIKSGKLWGAVS
jgi:hypothetical protein